MTTPHPHADLLHAIADGKQMQELRKCCRDDAHDCSAERALDLIPIGQADCVRIKTDTVTINGIECPAPMTEVPEMGSCYYVPGTHYGVKFSSWTWLDDTSDQRLFAEGLCFANADDAAAAARAMIAPLKLKGGAE